MNESEDSLLLIEKKEVSIMLLPSVFRDGFFDDDFMDFPPVARGQRESTLMKSDVRDAGDHFELDIDLPGFKKEDVKIQLKDGVLEIEATTSGKKDDKKKDGKYIRRERFQGTCTRQFYVGEETKMEDIRARFDNGVLKIDVAKPESKPQVKESRYITIE